MSSLSFDSFCELHPVVANCFVFLVFNFLPKYEDRLAWKFCCSFNKNRLKGFVYRDIGLLRNTKPPIPTIVSVRYTGRPNNEENDAKFFEILMRFLKEKTSAFMFRYQDVSRKPFQKYPSQFLSAIRFVYGNNVTREDLENYINLILRKIISKTDNDFPPGQEVDFKEVKAWYNICKCESIEEPPVEEKKKFLQRFQPIVHQFYEEWDNFPLMLNQYSPSSVFLWTKPYNENSFLISYSRIRDVFETIY